MFNCHWHIALLLVHPSLAFNIQLLFAVAFTIVKFFTIVYLITSVNEPESTREHLPQSRSLRQNPEMHAFRERGFPQYQQTAYLDLIH